jgi:hypothetical protein
MNTELAERVNGRIEADLSVWLQNSWAREWNDFERQTGKCDTTFCYAGHTVQEAGDTIVWSSYLDRKTQKFEKVGAEYCCDQYGNTWPIDIRAADLLDLDFDEMNNLFWTFTTDFDDMKAKIKYLADNKDDD